MTLANNAIVAGRFRLVRELERGGMGAVWLAHNIALDVPCALKFIDDGGEMIPAMRARFEREAKAAAQLRSPHVVQILDHGVWEDRPYIAMELLEGEDLRRRLERQVRLSPEETLEIVSQVARALTKAHAMGIVHRDLKPDNVFLVRDDDREIVKVLDFGIAKAATLGEGMSKTTTGALLGTPNYMSPEQADGTLTVDFRSDLWSLGVIVFECLTGVRPFESEALGDLLNRIMNKPLPIPSSVSTRATAAFDGWWAKACARSANERFQSAKELAEALGEALEVRAEVTPRAPPGTLVGPPAGSTPAEPLLAPTFDGQARPAARRAPSAPRRAFTLVAAAVAALAVAVSLAVVRGSPPSDLAVPESISAVAPSPAAAPPAEPATTPTIEQEPAPPASASSASSTSPHPSPPASAARAPRHPRPKPADSASATTPTADPGY